MPQVGKTQLFKMAVSVPKEQVQLLMTFTIPVCTHYVVNTLLVPAWSLHIQHTGLRVCTKAMTHAILERFLLVKGHCIKFTELGYYICMYIWVRLWHWHWMEKLFGCWLFLGRWLIQNSENPENPCHPPGEMVQWVACLLPVRFSGAVPESVERRPRVVEIGSS